MNSVASSFSFSSPLFKRFYHSSTLNTWGSYATKTLSLILVLPFILSRFNTGEIALWYLFSTVISLQLLADMGFSPTFTRVISYAMGGASELKDYRQTDKNTEGGQPNWDIIGKIYNTMQTVYFRLTLVSLVLLSVFGTWSLVKPISVLNEPTRAWIAWGVILVTSGIVFLGNIYATYLQGINQVALVRRWEIITSLGSILTSFLVLFFGGKLLSLVVANQIWLVINVLRNRYLCGIVEEGRYKYFKRGKIDKTILESVWPSAWRSGLGVSMSVGLIQASGLIYAQVGSTASVASYLLGLRFIQTVSLFSNAPFYSKLPLLARLRAENKLDQQLRIAQRGMLFAHWTYVTGFLVIGILAQPLLRMIGSNASFVSPLLWGIMGLAFFVERFGAMHIQLYSTTNHIIWHVANGVSGTIYILVSLFLFRHIGVYAFPTGILAGYLGFYSWYSAMHSYKTFNLHFFSFERKTMLVPLVLLCVYLIGTLVLYWH